MLDKNFSVLALQKRKPSPSFLTRVFWAMLAGSFMLSSVLFPAHVKAYKQKTPGNGYIIQGVPFEKWLKRNYCGPACLTMVFNYWNSIHAASQQQITNDIFDQQTQATYNSELVWYPRVNGYESYSFQGDLKNLKAIINNGIPVIVLSKTVTQIAKGHYRVVIGYDDDKDLIIFHDPYFGAQKSMKTKRFMKVWNLGEGHNQKRWMMAVLPRDSVFPLPQLLDDPMTSINLATAYYRKGDLKKSREEWENVRLKLNSDPYPVFSLAMISLKENKVDEAEAYALESLNLDAKNAYAHDVLGLIYARQGKISLSFETLGRALKLAPKEEFIRNHYVQVRDFYIKTARLKNQSQRGETHE